MATWTTDELDKIGTAEELEIAGLREDGSLRKPVTIWVVRVGDDLYVRSYRGAEGAWYRGTRVRHKGHIRAGGVEKDLDPDPALAAAIDTAYRIKYRRYGGQYVDPMVAAPARATTLKLVPR